MTTPCRACGATDRYPSGKCIPCTKKRVATYTQGKRRGESGKTSTATQQRLALHLGATK